MNISFENVNKLIILNYLYDNFRKRTGEEKSYTNIYLHTSRKTDRIIDGHGPWSNSMSFLLLLFAYQSFWVESQTINYSRLQYIQTNQPRSSERSLGLRKVRECINKYVWVNNQHEQTKSLQSQVKDLLLQSIHTRTFYLLSHAFSQCPKTVTTLIVYIYRYKQVPSDEIS